MESDWFTMTERNRVRQSEIIDETDREERVSNREKREREGNREWDWQRRERAGLIYLYPVSSHQYSCEDSTFTGANYSQLKLIKRKW